MKRIAPVKAVMTPFPHSVDSEQPLSAAVGAMDSHGIHHLPVTRGGALAGMLSRQQAEIGSRVRGVGAQDGELTVWDVCTREVNSMDLDERLDRVAELLARLPSGAAVVVRRDKVVGIVTTTDICTDYARLLRDEPRRPTDPSVA